MTHIGQLFSDWLTPAKWLEIHDFMPDTFAHVGFTCSTETQTACFPFALTVGGCAVLSCEEAALLT